MSSLDQSRPTAVARRETWHLDVLWPALALVLLALAAAWLVIRDPLGVLDIGAPPVERLTFERHVLDERGIHVKVRAGGSEPIAIAQVQVDDGYWRFTQEPSGEIARAASAWIRIPYPWVLGERHVVKVVTRTGMTFEHEIEVAVATPKPHFNQLRPQALVGAFVGIVPVALGLMFYPLLRRLGSEGTAFVLALTAGLLAFLLIDTLEDALELAGRAAPVFQGHVMVVMAGLLTFGALLALGRRRGTPTGLALAVYLALGIGLHNLGEGLAIGAAFATGAASLGTFLVLGFTLHNITEGIGIAAPLVKTRPALWTFAGLALLAGAPAIAGVWLGSLALTPHWASFALAVGAGAILQVLVELTAYMVRGGAMTDATLSRSVLAGFGAGVAVMYATGMLIKV
jgi:ZIP family zinc transporter